MTRYLYRVAFGITTSGNLDNTIEKIERLLIQTNPPGYLGLDSQIKTFEDAAFKRFKEKYVCQFRGEVTYIASEAIPSVPQTREIKADIEITFT